MPLSLEPAEHGVLTTSKVSIPCRAEKVLIGLKVGSITTVN